MVNCKKCNAILGEEVNFCPICGADQSHDYEAKIDNIDKKLTNSPTILISENSPFEHDDEANKQFELERLVKRGEECFNSGKKWLGAKDRTRARKDFQRAFNYYDTALKMDPNNGRIREMRSKCLFKMA